MEKYLMIAGAPLLGILGTIHLIYTFFTNRLGAFDPSVKEAKKSSSPVPTKDTTA